MEKEAGMSDSDYVEPIYKPEISEVSGNGYTISKRGAELSPPFADIFYYSDDDINFFFRASRFEIGDNDGEFIDNDEYVIDSLWKSNETLQYDKTNLDESAQIRALDNIVDGLHYMWSGSKPPPKWVRVQLRKVT